MSGCFAPRRLPPSDSALGAGYSFIGPDCVFAGGLSGNVSIVQWVSWLVLLFLTIVTHGPSWGLHTERVTLRRFSFSFSFSFSLSLYLSPNYSDRVETVLGHADCSTASRFTL